MPRSNLPAPLPCRTASRVFSVIGNKGRRRYSSHRPKRLSAYLTGEGLDSRKRAMCRGKKPVIDGCHTIKITSPPSLVQLGTECRGHICRHRNTTMPPHCKKGNNCCVFTDSTTQSDHLLQGASAQGRVRSAVASLIPTIRGEVRLDVRLSQPKMKRQKRPGTSYKIIGRSEQS